MVGLRHERQGRHRPPPFPFALHISSQPAVIVADSTLSVSVPFPRPRLPFSLFLSSVLGQLRTSPLPGEPLVYCDRCSGLQCVVPWYGQCSRFRAAKWEDGNVGLSAPVDVRLPRPGRFLAA